MAMDGYGQQVPRSAHLVRRLAIYRLVREAMITDHERWTDSTNYTVFALAL